jgi:membrane-bound lytic murein transglycosylase D
MKTMFLTCALAVLLCMLAHVHAAAGEWGLADLFSADTDGTRLAGARASALAMLPPLENKKFFESVGDLSILRRKEVRDAVYHYLTAGRSYIIAAHERSALCLDAIREILAQDKDLPAELAYLPIIESCYNPFAVSPSWAAGAWQFIPATGAAFGMKVNPWVDERRDVRKSTRAAASFLKSLYQSFGDWELALASYNGGPGHVRWAMAASGKTDYWELRRSGRLAWETSEYVVRFAAAIIVFTHGEEFGLWSGAGTRPAKSAAFALDLPVSIGQVSRITGVPVASIRALNPELNGEFTPLYEKNYPLQLPEEAIKTLTAQKETLYAFRFNAVNMHVVREGECLNAIAAMYHTSPQTIILFNDIKNPSLLRPGQVLYIPI